MKKKKMQPVIIRVEKEKYLQMRHELLDQGVTVNAFINDLIDERLTGHSNKQRSNEKDRPSAA